MACVLNECIPMHKTNCIKKLVSTAQLARLTQTHRKNRYFCYTISALVTNFIMRDVDPCRGTPGLGNNFGWMAHQRLGPQYIFHHLLIQFSKHRASYSPNITNKFMKAILYVGLYRWAVISGSGCPNVCNADRLHCNKYTATTSTTSPCERSYNTQLLATLPVTSCNRPIKNPQRTAVKRRIYTADYSTLTHHCM